jgi:hypothetical protein
MAKEYRYRFSSTSYTLDEIREKGYRHGTDEIMYYPPSRWDGGRALSSECEEAYREGYNEGIAARKDRRIAERHMATLRGYEALPDPNRGPGWSKFVREDVHVWECLRDGKFHWVCARLEGEVGTDPTYHDRLLDALEAGLALVKPCTEGA